MRLLLCFLFIFFLVPSVSALGISDTIADGIVSGVNRVILALTNQMYDLSGVNSTKATTELTNMMVQPNDFLSNPFVQGQKNVTAFWFEIFYFMFLLIGGIKLYHEAGTEEGMGLDSNSWRNTYITVAVVVPLIWTFYLIGFKWIFSLEFILSKSMSFEFMDFIPFSESNAIAYLFVGVVMLINIVFFSIRYLVVGIIAGWFLFVAIAWFIPYTKIYGKLIINYGLLMLFSRFVVVLILLGGFGIINGISALQNNSLYAVAPYLIVLIVAVLFELACIMYPILYVLAHSPIKYKYIKVR